VIERSGFSDARCLQAYAGSAPVTRACGKSLIVMARRVKNQRFAAGGYLWSFAALASPGARGHYDRRRAVAERHAGALGHLFNRMLGRFHYCLATGRLCEETVAFPTGQEATTQA
jgi:hypothetical protein